MVALRGVAVVVLAGCASGTDAHVSEVGAPTVVALTFDDTFADQHVAVDLLDERGLAGTFYINSPRIDQPGYLTADQLATMCSRGHEVGGHTLGHVDLTTLSADDARHQICDDRAALLARGYAARSFAYPFGASNAAVEQIAAVCGYNSARDIGGIGCSGCRYGNAMPAPDAYLLRSPGSVKPGTTLDELESYVIAADEHGGGLVPYVFHHVCDGCSTIGVSPQLLADFLDWLVARGTIVRTVGDAIGGPVQPGPPVNMLANPSLELDANGDQIPDCWQRGITGTSTATFTLVPDAFDGATAQRIEITSFTSGARRLASKQDSGACAPPVIAGHLYRVSAHYTSTTPPRFTIYTRSSAGTWAYFTQSPQFPVSATYAEASFAIPALPPDATAISVALSLFATGALTMDAFTLVDTTP